ncbi:MAG: hypothetical protein QGD94_12035, partial [Planctomycetia bacterium]|nr:hypothetical protein [Planctomycetia bacterium]
EAAPDGNWRLTDLSSAPQEDFWGGLGMSIAPTAHRTGAYVGSVDGHVEWLDWDEAYGIANGAKPNRFWCYPRSPQGGRDRV